MVLDELMLQLKLDYISEIPVKIRDIELALSEGRYDDIRTSFHKMKGSGSTYGIPEISKLGEVMEQLLTTDQNNKSQVQLGLKILEKIRLVRLNAKANLFSLENDSDYQKLCLSVYGKILDKAS